MASFIYLGACFGNQHKMDYFYFDLAINGIFRNTGLQAAIAKGNSIEGIEAKE